MGQSFYMPKPVGEAVLVFDAGDGNTYAMKLIVERITLEQEFKTPELHVGVDAYTKGGYTIWQGTAADVFRQQREAVEQRRAIESNEPIEGELLEE